MENLKKEYEDSKISLENTLQLLINQLKFDEEKYQVKTTNQIKSKCLKKELEDGIEITIKEIIRKNSSQIDVIIDKYYNKKDFDRFIIHDDSERISLTLEKYKTNKMKKMIKEYTKFGQIITLYSDQDNFEILHQNKNSEIMYLDEFQESKFNTNLFMNKEGIKYISRFPYDFAYESVVLGNIQNEEELTKKFEFFNYKRKSVNAALLSLNVDHKKIIEERIEKISFICSETENMINDLIKILSYIKIDDSGNKEQEEKGESHLQEENNIMSELEILKNEKKEFQEIEKKTLEIIEKLTKVVEENA